MTRREFYLMCVLFIVCFIGTMATQNLAIATFGMCFFGSQCLIAVNSNIWRSEYLNEVYEKWGTTVDEYKKLAHKYNELLEAHKIVWKEYVNLAGFRSTGIPINGLPIEKPKDVS